MLGYLDAGSGSVIVAAVVAGVAGIGVFFRMLWQRIRHPFSGERVEDETDEALDTDDHASPDFDSDAEVRTGDQGA